jgi:hypothetical protein
LWLHRQVFGGLRSHIGGLMKAAALAAGGIVRRALTPAAEQGTVRGLVLDLTRSRRQLLAENAVLRHQLLVAARQLKRPKLRPADRLVLVGLAAMFAHWCKALVLVEPETLLVGTAIYSAACGLVARSPRRRRNRVWRRKPSSSSSAWR